jgi:hypothetical protein
MLPTGQYAEDDEWLDEPPPIDPATPDTSLTLTESSPEFQAFSRFVTLTKRKRELEAELDSLKKQINALSIPLRDYLSRDSGHYDKVTVKGYTISVRSQVFARHFEHVSAQQVCDALRQVGMGQFVRDSYSSQALSNHVRELEAAHKEELKNGTILSLSELLPAPLARVLNVEPTHTIIARKVAEKK